MLTFLSTVTTFGTALDPTAAELSIEAFLPADAETARALEHHWSYHLTSDRALGQHGRMALQPVNRRSVPEDVFDQIIGEVLSGQMQPGETLPSERRLAEGTRSVPSGRTGGDQATHRSRPGRGARQGDSTTVRTSAEHAGLDLLPRLLLRAGELDVSVVRSILETRLHNGPKVAELAAQRAPADVIAQLGRTVDSLAAESDPVAQQRHALAFWDLVVDGADSIAFRLMYNTLRQTYEPVLPALATMMADEVGRPDAYRRIVETIEAGDPAAARHAATELLEPATTALMGALDALEETR